MTREEFLGPAYLALASFYDLKNSQGEYDENDSLVRMSVNLAFSQISAYCSRQFIYGGFVERGTLLLSSSLVLSERPLESVSYLAINDSEVEFEVSKNEVIFDSKFTGKYVAKYSGGFLSVDEESLLFDAVLIQSATLYRQRDFFGIKRVSESNTGGISLLMSSTGTNFAEGVFSYLDSLKNISSSTVERI